MQLDTQQGRCGGGADLCGAVLRLFSHAGRPHGAKRTGLLAQALVIASLLVAWRLGVHSYAQILLLGMMLGVAGASFAVALPLASRWYPPEHQGTAMGIAGAGNSGTVFAALFAPMLAIAFGYQAVFGLACIPLVLTLLVFAACAKDAPVRPRTIGRLRPRVGRQSRLVGVNVLLRDHIGGLPDSQRVPATSRTVRFEPKIAAGRRPLRAGRFGDAPERRRDADRMAARAP